MSAAPEHPPEPQQTPTRTLDPLQADTAAVSSRSDSDSSIPERLGEFRITALLGRGGMGTVYLAEQQNPVREVALKVLRGAQDDADALRRFRLEGEALALLDHPNIAHVFATGVDVANGANTPYLAMELVRGRSLLADAEARALDVEGRVRLMLAVCHGVQHAHQRGVIHRDLKPANILVDHEGRPKIMDFGIARITSGGNDAATRLTEAGQVVGTIPYMSPEQLRGETGKIDVRTDVFALGVILYELLCGKRPRDLDASSLFSAIKSAERLPLVPLVRVEAKFGGDLDTIVMKALAEERSQRYASVGELANDLERYLDHRPIEARAPSALYIAGKFARRNRALVTAAGIAVLALIAATVFSLLSAQREREARTLAESKTAVADAVNEFTRNMLRGASVFQNQGKPVTVTDLLDDAGRALDRDLATQPIAAGEVALLLADAHKSLGQYEPAIALSARAASALPPSSVHLESHAQAVLTHVSALLAVDRVDEAANLLDTAWTPIEPRLSRDSPSRLDALRMQANVVDRKGDPNAARLLLERGIADASPTAPEEGLRSLRQNLALLLRDLGEVEAARTQFQSLLRESLAQGDEIQIQEGVKTPHGMGAVINETESPYDSFNGIGKWNSYDIVFRAARFKDGKLVEKPLVSMYFNGQKVHTNQTINQVWGGPNSGLDGGNDDGKGITDVPGGLKLQCEGHDVRYRNTWIKELDLKEANTDFAAAD